MSQMFDTLRYDGFMPLHYEIVWLLTRPLGHAIWVLRLPSLLAGVALPAAVYAAARPMVGRRAGVYAAAMTAASAFFAYFEHNAKMYACAWLMMTLAVACLLRFALTGRRLAWLGFVFFGVAAGGLYALTAGVLGLAPLIAAGAARRRILARAALATLGVGIIAAAPIVYYTALNHWLDTSGGLSNSVHGANAPHDNGLMWIGDWQSGRSPANTLLSSVSSYLFGYELPVSADDVAGDPVARRVYDTAWWAMVAVAAVVIVAVVRAAIHGGHLLRRRGAAWTLALLIFLPLYGFYLRCFTDLLPPWALLPGGVVGTLVIVVIAIMSVAGVLRRGWPLRQPVRAQAIRTAILVAAIGLLMFLLWLATWWQYRQELAAGQVHWNNLWMPRYAGVVAPFLLIALAAALDRLPSRPLRWLAIAAFLGLNLVVTIAWATVETEWPGPEFSRDQADTIAHEGDRMLVAWAHNAKDHGMPPLPSPYYQLAQAAGAELDPPGFRYKVSWPFFPGPAMRDLLERVRQLPAGAVRRPKNLVGVDRIFYWRTLEAQPADPPAIPGFTLMSQTLHHVHFVWTWFDRGTYERLEYVRDKKS